MIQDLFYIMTAFLPLVTSYYREYIFLYLFCCLCLMLAMLAASLVIQRRIRAGKWKYTLDANTGIKTYKGLGYSYEYCDEYKKSDKEMITVKQLDMIPKLSMLRVITSIIYTFNFLAIWNSKASIGYSLIGFITSILSLSLSHRYTEIKLQMIREAGRCFRNTKSKSLQLLGRTFSISTRDKQDIIQKIKGNEIFICKVKDIKEDK